MFCAVSSIILLLASSFQGACRKQKPRSGKKPTRPGSMTEIIVFSDSQGRGVAEKIYSLSKKTVISTGIVLTNGKFFDIIRNARKYRHDYIALIGGTIDSLRGTIQEIYKYLEENLDSLGSKKFVCILTIPKRHDLPENDPIHEELKMVNNYIVEVAARMNNVEVIDVHSLTRSMHTSHGLHINTRGKTKVASLILEAIKKSGGNSSKSGVKTCCSIRSIAKTEILLESNSFGTSRSASVPTKESFVDTTFEQEVEEGRVKNSSRPDSVRFLPSKHFGCSLETEPKSSNSSLHLVNEQNSLKKGKRKFPLPELTEFDGDSDTSKNLIRSESLDSSTTQEYSKTPPSTSSVFHEYIDTLQTTPQTSTPFTMKNSASKGTKISDVRKMKSEILLKKMSKRKYFLPEKNLNYLNRHEVKNLVRERDLVKKCLNLSAFPIKKSRSSRKSVNSEKLPVTCSMLERSFCFIEENLHENVREKNKVVKTVYVSEGGLFENPSSFCLTAVMAVAMYLFLSEFFFLNLLV